jgi:uncharacterized membrane protein YkoI
MRRFSLTPLLTAAAIGVAALFPSGYSQASETAPSATTQTAVWHLAQAPANVGPEKAAAIARSATGGRVLGVRGRQRDEAPVYEVKVLSADGRVHVIRVDGRTGTILP